MTWKDSNDQFNTGPHQAYGEAKRLMPYWFKLMAFAMIGFAGLGLLGSALGWFGEAATMAKEEFGPRASLAKYEWFKDVAAQLDKKRADIQIYQRGLDRLRADYVGKPRSEWDRIDRQIYNQKEAEVAGVTASYNDLAAEYNAQMAKFNWSFANAGELPKGAVNPLPREFKSYTTGSP